MNKLFIILVLIAFQCMGAQEQLQLDSAFAKATAQEAIIDRVAGTVNIDELDFKHLIVSVADDEHGRSFRFIGVPNRNSKQAGYFAVFELCEGRTSAYQLSYSGFSKDLKNEQYDFELVKSDKTADFPGECSSGDD